MTTENVAQFKEFVDQNEQLKAQLKESNSASSFLEKVVQMGEQNGFQFSAQDVRTYLEDANQGDLSEQQLEEVAGGRSRFTVCVAWSDCWCGSSC